MTELKDNFYSLFSGSLFYQLRQNCTRKVGASSPVFVADAAAFLLDETTSYVDNTRTDHSEVLRSRTIETSHTPTDVLVDPFQATSRSSSVRNSASPEEADSDRSTAIKLAQSVIPDTTSQASSGRTIGNNQQAQDTGPSSILKNPSVTVAVSETPEQDTETLDNSSQKNPATGLEVQPKAKSSFVVKTVATSSVVRIDALYSLI